MSLTAEKSAVQTLTYEDYLAEGETEGRYDIVNGVRVWMSNPTVRYQDVLFNIAAAFKSYSRDSGQGRMIVAACDALIRRIPKLQTRQPDVLFISRERFGSRDPEDPRPLDPAPELVVEILSPSDTKRVLADTLRDYRAADVRECWVVSPDSRTVEVLRLRLESEQTAAVYGPGETVRSEAFPDLSAAVSDIFAP